MHAKWLDYKWSQCKHATHVVWRPDGMYRDNICSVPLTSRRNPWFPSSENQREVCLCQACWYWDDLSPKLPSPVTSVFKLRRVPLQSRPQTGAGNDLAKNGPLLWDIPEVTQIETTGIPRRLTRPWELWQLTQGSGTDVPRRPVVLFYDPIPLGGCQHHSGQAFWLETCLIVRGCTGVEGTFS